MRLSELAFRLSVGVISSLFLIAAAAASGAGNDPCKVLTAETFSQIMGYKATLDKTGSTDVLFLSRPGRFGWTILDPHRDCVRTASGRHAQESWVCATRRQRPDRRLLPSGKHHLFCFHQVNGASQVAGTRGRNKTQSKVILFQEGRTFIIQAILYSCPSQGHVTAKLSNLEQTG